MSDYKTILLHLADPRRAKRAIDLAIDLAGHSDGHLVALFAMPPVIVIGAGMPGTPNPIIIDDLRKQFERNAATIQSMFEAALATGRCRGEWRRVEAEGGSVSGAVLTAARSCDIVVTNQAESAWEHSELFDIPWVLATESGRPTIIVPKTGGVSVIGKRILVGWNGQREATRAVFDALPLLRRAEVVRVVWSNAEDTRKSSANRLEQELAAALVRHGVRCEAGNGSTKLNNAGAALLAEATAFKADLMVMGCYGHSRLREFIFGGATRHVLAHMHVPVLMAH